MRKFALSLIGVVAVAAFAASGASWANILHGERVKVTLSAVPGVTTSAGGDASFELSKDGKRIHYRLNLNKIENVTMAHVHAVGADGTPAAILTWTYPAKGEAPALKAGGFSGKLVEGDITEASLSGPLKGSTVKALFEQIEYGKAGVAVHTKQHAGGELWGIHKEAKAKKAAQVESDGGSAPGY
jgi:hypothetical protein